MEKRTSVGIRIRLRRRELRLTQQIVSKKLGVTASTISQWESGMTEPTGENLLALSKVLGCDPNWIINGVSDVESISPERMGGNVIPVISYAQAGAWTKNTQLIDSETKYIQTDQNLSQASFGLKIVGNSMSIEFNDGDIIIVDPEIAPCPGDYVIAKDASEEEATFKKYRPRGMVNGVESFELVPLNDDYPTLRSTEQEIIIIGVMVEHRRYRRR